MVNLFSTLDISKAASGSLHCVYDSGANSNITRKCEDGGNFVFFWLNKAVIYLHLSVYLLFSYEITVI